MKISESDGIKRLKEWFLKNKILVNGRVKCKLGSPLSRPSKIICVGLNYAEHASESGMGSKNLFFFKSSSAIVITFDPIIV